MDQKIEAYIAEIVSQLKSDAEEKRDIIDEMRDHLHLLKDEYIAEGYAEDEATAKALASFGERKQLATSLQKSMFPFYKLVKVAAFSLFSLYSLLVLFKLVVERIIVRLTDYYVHDMPFNRYVVASANPDGYIQFLQANSNLIPFKNTMTYAMGTGQFNVDIILHNTLGNLLIFLPLGIFLPLLFTRYSRFSKLIVAAMVVSFSIETLQIMLQIGQFDIDDVILNTFGSLAGFCLLKMLKKIIPLPKHLSRYGIMN